MLRPGSRVGLKDEGYSGTLLVGPASERLLVPILDSFALEHIDRYGQTRLVRRLDSERL